MATIDAFPFDSQVESYESDGTPIYDRATDSKGFRNLLKTYFNEGVFPKPSNALQVVENGNLGALVKKGSCMVGGVTILVNEDIKVTLGEADELIIYDDNIMIYGTLLEGIEDYPVEEISRYLDVAFDSYCKIPKALLLSVLDRLQLFIEPYDKNGAYFNFTRKGLNIHSRKDASTETINYIESHEFKPFTCLVDIPMLKEQLINVLDTLTPREEKVLRLRFGLDDGRARTLEEVGREFNVTRERIRQIEAKALRKLKHPSRSKRLKDFLDR